MTPQATLGHIWTWVSSHALTTEHLELTHSETVKGYINNTKHTCTVCSSWNIPKLRGTCISITYTVHPLHVWCTQVYNEVMIYISIKTKCTLICAITDRHRPDGQSCHIMSCEAAFLFLCMTRKLCFITLSHREI